jgi:hypothetical protein
VKSKLLTYLLFLPIISFSQNNYKIETTDIDNFWKAYDYLENAETKADSIKIIQEFYIDKATEEFKEFIRVRNFTSEEYVLKLSLYPKFWKSIRSKTLNIKTRKKEIEIIFEKFERVLPNFKKPKVCFAIGCLRTGGTVSKELILIGSEIASADATVDKSELSSWLQSIIGKTGDINGMIAHETIHTQQINVKKLNLLTGVMNEGIADFITYKIFEENINKESFAFGVDNECKLRKEFITDLKNNPKDYSKWLYSGNKSGERPADLGYYIGFKIAQEYYETQTDKRKALNELLNHKKYRKIFKKSKFKHKSCG